jgi:HTH-type transcriptional regulator/antitoxin MqsA
MKCPVCGEAELIRDTRDLSYTYKGETTTLAAVTADFCPACDESITDAAESDRVMREMQAFSKQVNAAIVDPEFIASVRKKLDLGQREAAEIFGGGVNAFSRYENGRTKPPLALVKLLKLLDMLRATDLALRVTQPAIPVKAGLPQKTEKSAHLAASTKTAP